MAIDFTTIKQAAILRSEELLREWYPEGRVRGAEFVIGDPEGNAGDSMSINLNKGIGMDFATGKKFGDLIDVYAARFGVDIKTAAVALADRFSIKVARKDRDEPRAPRKAATPPPPKTWRQVWAEAGCKPIPPDVEITPDAFAIPRRGKPDHLYVYRDLDGTPLWVVTRWDAVEAENLTKLFLPWQFRIDGWQRGGVPAPRCLYGLELLPGNPRNVVIVEGEKAAEAARRLLPTSPVLSWANGAASVTSTDWSDLKGRKVVIWPDADAPGLAALNEIANLIAPIVDGPVRYVDAGNVEPGFDAADLGNMSPEAAFQWVKARLKVWNPPTAVEPLAEVLPQEPVVETKHVPDARWGEYGLELRASGTPHPSIDNAVRILGHKIPAGDIHFDSFLNQIRIRGTNGAFIRLVDHHLVTLTIAIQRDHLMQDMKKSTVADAIEFYARSNTRNCLTEWLQSLQWDNVARVEDLMTMGFGAEDNEYTRAVSRNFLIGMVARAMRPGCQLDTLPILEGAQGIGKSQGLRALAGQFYADIDTAMGTKEFAEQLQGKWLVELSELSAMRPSDVEKVKSGITRTVDVYREPFAVLASDHPRQCVFAGTTNAENYLVDTTGNRRFWPVRCGVINREWIIQSREALFAEALHLYTHGTNWWTMPGDLARKEVDSRMFGDALTERVRAYTESHGTNVRINEVLEAWDVPEAQWSAPLQRRIADALRALGWQSTKSNGRQVWRAPTGQMPIAPGTVSNIRRL